MIDLERIRLRLEKPANGYNNCIVKSLLKS